MNKKASICLTSITSGWLVGLQGHILELEKVILCNMAGFGVWCCSWDLTSKNEGFCFGGFGAEHGAVLCASERDFDLNVLPVVKRNCTVWCLNLLLVTDVLLKGILVLFYSCIKEYCNCFLH